MSAKNNIRSFRYSDEIANILEQQPGESLNEKFNTMIQFAFLQKAEIQADIAKLEKKRQSVLKQLQDLQSATARITNLNYFIIEAERSLKRVEEKARDFEESFK